VSSTGKGKSVADGTIDAKTLPRDGVLRPPARSWER
jgi:hypothetical protein